MQSHAISCNLIQSHAISCPSNSLAGSDHNSITTQSQLNRNSPAQSSLAGIESDVIEQSDAITCPIVTRWERSVGTKRAAHSCCSTSARLRPRRKSAARAQRRPSSQESASDLTASSPNLMRDAIKGHQGGHRRPSEAHPSASPIARALMRDAIKGHQGRNQRPSGTQSKAIRGSPECESDRTSHPARPKIVTATVVVREQQPHHIE